MFLNFVEIVVGTAKLCSRYRKLLQKTPKNLDFRFTDPINWRSVLRSLDHHTIVFIHLKFAVGTSVGS